MVTPPTVVRGASDGDSVLPIKADVSDSTFSNKRVNVLLDDTNFLLWEQQVSLLIRGQDLKSYLDPNAPVPAKFTVAPDGTRTVNSAYLKYVKQDCSLAS
ncbi:hypothetical protein HRI_001672500 [Hibiscus trionum]|uniref:Retrotransposon Copia-like N-terminal domain-containing protein n=1 Tax=Hibiscus trionum TaxID=183268 RepID=A0A9W7HMD3_HIBTR|nr:hypothetical protein HRI_001672500 [Hibiscus trionum]